MSPWFVSGKKKKRASIRIFCFHSAGSTASQFRIWDDMVCDDIEIIGVQLPGRESRYKETAIRDVRELVRLIGPELVELLDRPFAFFGHSYGSLVAYETCLWLREHTNLMPKHLFAVSRQAPQVPRRFDVVHELPDEKLLDVLRIYGGTSEKILSDSKAIKVFLPTIRADLCANDTYLYQEESKLDCSITIICGDADQVCSAEDILEWRDRTSVEFESKFYSGGHFFYTDYKREIISLMEQSLLDVHQAAR